MTEKLPESGSSPTAEVLCQVGEVAVACGATLTGPADLPVTGYSWDSRRVRPGQLFCALAGERVDGHQFLPQAWAAGASAALVSQPVDPPPGRATLLVDDVLQAFGRLGARWRDRFDPLTVGITGSVGKSSTKQLVTAVLATEHVTLSSPASYNNELGLPATLLELRPEHTALVLEMAMRGPDQIRYLADLARPTIGVITNIGTSHVGLLGSREAIAAAKGELLDGLGPDGVAVLCADDPHLREVARRHAGRTIWYGFGEGAEVTAAEVTSRGLAGSSFRLQTPAGGARVDLPFPGRHMVLNALGAAAVGLAAGLSPRKIAAGLAACESLPLRLQVVDLGNGARVLNDAYNAAPDSVRAALEVLASEPTSGRRIAVLGDMLELGHLTEVEHLKTGHAAAGVVDLLIGVGELGGLIAAGAADAGLTATHHAADAAAAAELLAELTGPGDLILLKASRAVALEQVLASLEGGES